MGPASAAERASGADSPAAPSTPASSEPSCGPIQTHAPQSADSARPPILRVALEHTVPPCTCLRYPTENKTPTGAEPRSTPSQSLLSVKSDLAGGLLLLRHVTPLSRRHVV